MASTRTGATGGLPARRLEGGALFWGKGTEELLKDRRTQEEEGVVQTEQIDSSSARSGASSVDSASAEDVSSTSTSNNNGEESAKERSESIVKVSKLSNAASLDDFLGRSGPKIKDNWEKQIGFDRIKREQQFLRHLESGVLPQQQKAPAKQGKARPLRPRPKPSSGPESIDKDLLRQALQYNGKPSFVINSDAIMEGPSVQNRGTSQVPSARVYGAVVSGQQPKQRKAVKKKMRKRPKKRVSKYENSPFGSMEPLVSSGAASSTASSSKTKPPSAEMQALIDNFRTGASVQDLRRQLQQSQQSLHSSNAFIETATSKWFRPT